MEERHMLELRLQQEADRAQRAEEAVARKRESLLSRLFNLAESRDSTAAPNVAGENRSPVPPGSAPETLQKRDVMTVMLKSTPDRSTYI